jgi:hypothetical protein
VIQELVLKASSHMSECASGSTGNGADGGSKVRRLENHSYIPDQLYRQQKRQQKTTRWLYRDSGEAQLEGMKSGRQLQVCVEDANKVGARGPPKASWLGPADLFHPFFTCSKVPSYLTCTDHTAPPMFRCMQYRHVL